jgi:hypothetical protein
MDNYSNNFVPSRRTLLQAISSGFGYLAFSSMATLASANQRRVVDDKSGNPLAAKAPHFTPRAKRVIFLCMRGGPSHVDTFDYKPQLTRDNGKSGRYRGALLQSPWKFSQHGKSGLWISELFPELSKMADDLCLLRGMNCDQPVHPRALTQMHTGNAQFVRPSLGAWALYGLGTENENMPGFISVNPPAGTAQNYGSAFLPAIYQGTKISGGGGGRRFQRGGAESIPDIKSSRMTKNLQREQLDFIQALNKEKLDREKQHPGVEGVIESFELAFRMQDAVPDLMDISGESEKTLEMYGIGQGNTDGFGRQCLMARRFAESGVRFIEVSHGNWDHHFNLDQALPQRTTEIDKPIAGLLQDLKQRNMLDDTLVIWAGEFGRTPSAQNGNGRDHNNKGYTTWMAGGGVKGGFSFGNTDEHGFEAVEGKCHIHDWHATILHLLGLDHQQLTYRYAGRDFRLTDVYGNVLKDIMA